MSLFNNAQVLEAARILRPLLSQKLKPNIAQEIDNQLAQLLNQTDLEENTKADRILEVLDSLSETKILLDDYLQFAQSQRSKSYYPLPGEPALQNATKYVCPIGNDYTRYLENDRDIPLCPTHLVKLVPVQPEEVL